MVDLPKMAGPKPPLVKRMEATQATLDRFNGKAFGWSTNDCGRLVAFHVRRMGYKAPMPTNGSYKDAKAAVRALKALTTHTRMEDALDSYLHLRRISWAEAMQGDLCAMPAENDEEWAAMAMVLDNGRVLGWFTVDGECVARVATVRPEAVTACWRVEPQ